MKEEVVEQHSEHPPLIAQLMEMNSAILSVDDEISNLLSAFDGTDMDVSIYCSLYTYIHIRMSTSYQL